jgi:hypothetical protein
VELLREALGPELADMYVPLTNGGVQLHKLQGVMHDTCNRADKAVYQPILMDVLRLFGLAIHTSLERTLGKYLKATDGIFCNDLRSDWEVTGVAKLLCTNNAAERPFGVAKGPAHVSLPRYPHP